MITALAQMPTPTYAEIGMVLAVLVAIGGAYTMARKAERSAKGQGEPREISPQPLEIKAAEEFVRVPMCEKAHVRIEAELARHTASRRSIYEKLDLQATAISALSTASSAHASELAELRSEIKGDTKALNQRLDELPDRIFSLLTRSKALHHE